LVSKQRLWTMHKIAEGVAPLASAAVGEMSELGKQSGLLMQANTACEFLQVAKAVGKRLNIGVTTVFHGLCDMGFDAIKPDMHATRSLGYFGSVAPLAFDDHQKYLRHDLHKAQVVAAGVALARTIVPLPEFAGYPCREVDVILLYASEQDFLPFFQRSHAAPVGTGALLSTSSYNRFKRKPIIEDVVASPID
jgi:hypothetical protein